MKNNNKPIQSADKNINSPSGNPTISAEENFATLFASHRYLLLASNSLDFAGTIFEISKLNDFIQFRLLTLTSEMDDQNMLSFGEAQSFVVSSSVFDKLVDAYRGNDLVTLLTKVLDSCPIDDLLVYDAPQENSLKRIISGEVSSSSIKDIDTIIETILEISQIYSLDLEYVLGNLLNADYTAWEQLLNGSLDWFFEED